jgi:hypothetical protein
VPQKPQERSFRKGPDASFFDPRIEHLSAPVGSGIQTIMIHSRSEMYGLGSNSFRVRLVARVRELARRLGKRTHESTEQLPAHPAHHQPLAVLQHQCHL